MKKFKILFLVIGVIFFAFLVYKVGFTSITESLSKVGYKFIVIFLLWLLFYFFQNFAWALEMRKSFKDVGFLSLLKARIAGEAMNGLIPLGNFGGEPVKAYIIGNKAPKTEIVASLVLDKTVFAFGSLLYIVTGLIVAIFAVGKLSIQWRVAAFVLVGLMVYGLIWFVRKKTFFTQVCTKLEKLGIATKFFGEKMGKIQEMDARIASFYRSNKRRFLASLLLHFCGRMISAVEFYLVFSYLGFNLGFVHALYVSSLTMIAYAIFMFVPGHWGIGEGAQGFIFLTLGLSPADGIAVGVVRRIRHIFYTLIGILIFYFSNPEKHKEVVAKIGGEPIRGE